MRLFGNNAVRLRAAGRSSGRGMGLGALLDRRQAYQMVRRLPRLRLRVPAASRPPRPLPVTFSTTAGRGGRLVFWKLDPEKAVSEQFSDFPWTWAKPGCPRAYVRARLLNEHPAAGLVPEPARQDCGAARHRRLGNVP